MQQILSLMETIQELMMGYELTDIQYEELRTAWYDVDHSFELSRPMSELEEMERELFDHFYHVEYEENIASFSQQGDETLFHVEYPCVFPPEYGTGDVKITTGVFTEEDIKELKPKSGIIYIDNEEADVIVESFLLPSPSGLGKPNQVLITDGQGQIKWVDHEGTLFDPNLKIEHVFNPSPEFKSSTETLTIIGAFDDAMKVVDD